MKRYSTILKRLFLLLLPALLAPVAARATENPKREFRGAWLHVVGDLSYRDKTPQQQRAMITKYLDNLAEAGVNAIIFQVRPSADALYISDLEPWSMWLTGKRGLAPDPVWDPMQFVLEESHKRGMEFHAWLNPYRVTLASEKLPADHPANTGSDLYFKYNGQVYFDPGRPENRKHIAKVVKDIVERYDIDAIHMDDYFYPYPGKTPFNADAATYAKYGNGKNISEWRRENVDKLIEELHEVIHDTKPWVRFGVSPFGIWRNKKNDPRGSDTNGLENYSGLYADVLKWAKNGWIDYMAPQLYWELDHKAASSRHLAEWWSKNSHGVPVYIGQDVKRTMDKPDVATGKKSELDTKVKLSRSLPGIEGNVWWHGYWVGDNYKGVADSLAYNYQSTLALPPVYGNKSKRPEGVGNARIEQRDGRTFLKWDLPPVSAHGDASDPVRFVVYEFLPGETPDIEMAEAIIAITPADAVEITEDLADPSMKGVVFGITSLDRQNRESVPYYLKH